MKYERREKWRIFLREGLFWLSLRIIALISFQFLVETTFKMGWLAFLGPDDVQTLAYDVLQKLLLTLYVWFFFAAYKKFVVPTATTAFSPPIDKFVRKPVAKKRTLELIRRYLIYLGYALVIIALISIWAYSYVGIWLVGFMGTTLVVTLTFILGLFTSSVLGNILAYWVLNNSMEFKNGDRVQIGDTYGDVVELSMFFTRIRTIKDEIISIPNLAVMGKEVKNFSSLAAVLIHVSVTLGYNVSKEKAKGFLIKCAEQTEGILTNGDKKPFVLLTDLGKYTVTYEVNAYTDKPNALVKIKSDLIDNILSEFKKSKIELLSPTYVALREETSRSA